MIIAVLVVIAIALILIVLKPSTTGNVVKAFQNCREVQVPYEETEEYSETVPYIKNVNLEYETDVGYETSNLFECSTLTNHRFCSKIGVFNKDIIGGIFEVKCEFQALNRNFYDSEQAYIKAGEVGIFTCVADINIREDVKLSDYKIIPPTKEVTDYKEVTRTRTVTKYRTEEQCD